MTVFPPPSGPPVTTSSAHAGPTFAPEREPHPTLPVQVAVGAIVVLIVSLFSSKYLLDALIVFEWPVAVYVAVLGATRLRPLADMGSLRNKSMGERPALPRCWAGTRTQ